MDHDEFREQIRDQFAAGPLERGSQHPLARLLHHSARGGMDLAKVVAEVGPEFLQGGDRLTFKGYVDRIFPEQAEAERAGVQKKRAKEHEERMSDLASKLKARTAERVERRLSHDFTPIRGHNTPLDV
jgi:hypothetical protein